MTMRDEGWSPYSLQGRGRPFRFNILLRRDSVSVEVSVNLEGTDLLNIEVFCWATKCWRCAMRVRRSLFRPTSSRSIRLKAARVSPSISNPSPIRTLNRHPVQRGCW